MKKNKMTTMLWLLIFTVIIGHNSCNGRVEKNTEMDKKEQIPTIESEVLLRYKMFAEPFAKGKNWPSFRRTHAKLCLQTWYRLDKEKDEHFDPKAMPELNVNPPKETELPPGVAPDEIKDSQLKKEYMQAIERNRKKTVYYNEQYQIRKVESEYKRIATVYLIDLYSKTPKATSEFTELLEMLVMDKKTVKELTDRLDSKW